MIHHKQAHNLLLPQQVVAISDQLFKARASLEEQTLDAVRGNFLTIKTCQRQHAKEALEAKSSPAISNERAKEPNDSGVR